jgi:phosphoglycolate phosphatase
MIELIIFDLDGTLVDSSRDLTNAINYSIEGTGLPEFKVEQTVRIVGEGVTRLIEKLVPPALAHRKGEVMERFLDYYSSHLTDFTRAYPGVKETLAALSHIKKAVVSNKRAEPSRRILERLELIGHFDEVLGSDTLGVKKPSPIPILHLLNRFSAAPDNTIMVGDSELDISAGKSAAVRTIAVTYGFRPAEILKDADILIDDIGKLVEIVNKNIRQFTSIRVDRMMH